MEEELTTHSSILAWKEPGELRPWLCKRVRHNQVTTKKQEYMCVCVCVCVYTHTHIYTHTFSHSFLWCFITGYWIWFPVLYNGILFFIHPMYKSANHKLSIHCPLVFGNNKSFLYVWESVSVFCRSVHLCCILGSYVSDVIWYLSFSDFT